MESSPYLIENAARKTFFNCRSVHRSYNHTDSAAVEILGMIDLGTAFLAADRSDGVRLRTLHLRGDSYRTGIERTAKDFSKREYIVNMIGEVAAARPHDSDGRAATGGTISGVGFAIANTTDCAPSFAYPQLRE
jgi:hypothetical protein